MGRDLGSTPATKILARLGVSFRVRPYVADDAGGYGQAAAAALGVSADEIFKTLIAEVDGVGLVVGVVPVSSQLDLKALARAAGGKKAHLAEAAVAERSSGMVVGGISPIGQRMPLPTFIDETVELMDEVYVSAGKRGMQVSLAPADLIAVTGATIAALCGR